MEAALTTPLDQIIPRIFAMADSSATFRLDPRLFRKRNPKARGEWAEIAFLAKATSLGLTVCKPYGDNKAFDFVVESAGRTTRVQVKSCWRRGQWRGYPARACNSRRPYRRGEIDFIVLYVVPKDVWYVIPAAAVANTWLVVVYPTVRRSRGKFEKYREAWHLLTSSG